MLAPVHIPAEALAPFPYLPVAAVALAASIAIHAVLLMLHFSLPAFKLQHDRTPPLEIALVNAKTKLAPAKADILAQANLDGGGNTDEKRRAKSPLPPLHDASPRHRIAVPQAPPPPSERPASERLTQRASTVVLPLPAPQPADVAPATPSPTVNQLMHT